MTDIIKFNDTHTPKTAIGENKMSNEITSHLNKAKTLLIEKYSNGIDIEANREALENIKRDFEFLEIYAGKNNADEQDQPQNTVKSIVKTLQNISLCPWEHAEEDIDVLGDLVYSYVTDLCNALGFEDISETYTENSKNTIKEQLQDIYSLNDSMITGDPNYIPTFDDGTSIRTQDLADMNMQTLDLIAEMLGFELEEGATSWTRQEDKPTNEMTDQEVYDSLPAEDKLNVDMLNKLYEVRDYLLDNGQTYLGKNRITTATNLLKCGFGVIDHEEE